MQITLATLPQATEQQVLDQVAVGLLNQGRRSGEKDFDPYGNPAWSYFYRGPGGTKCGGGFLIADSEYSEKLEGPVWTTHVEAGRFPREHQSLISRLQSIHDRLEPSLWKASLIDLATDSGLSSDTFKDL